MGEYLNLQSSSRSLSLSLFNVRASTPRSLDMAPPHRPLMNSHAHVILELPAPKEVSMISDLNLSASFSSQDFFTFHQE